MVCVRDLAYVADRNMEEGQATGHCDFCANFLLVLGRSKKYGQPLVVTGDKDAQTIASKGLFDCVVRDTEAGNF